MSNQIPVSVRNVSMRMPGKNSHPANEINKSAQDQSLETTPTDPELK